MTDLRLTVDDIRFAVRTVILCTRGDELLVHRDPGLLGDLLALPGGAVEAGEDSRTAAAREWLEETGLPCGELRLVAVVENFFTMNSSGQRWHELGYYYRMTPPDALPVEGATLRDNAVVTQHWVPLADAARVVPPIAAELLVVPPGEVRHFVLHRP